MNHVESRMETAVGFDRVNSLTCFGVSRRGAADEDIFMDEYNLETRKAQVDDRSTRNPIAGPFITDDLG
jgi:hypothetical protein